MGAPRKIAVCSLGEYTRACQATHHVRATIGFRRERRDGFTPQNVRAGGFGTSGGIVALQVR